MTSPEIVPVYPAGRYRVSPNKGFRVFYYLTMGLAPLAGLILWLTSHRTLALMVGVLWVTVLLVAPMMWVTKTPPHTKEF